MRKKGVLLVTNSFEHDSRVLKEAITLRNVGYDVTVVAMHKVGLEEFDVVNQIPVHRIKIKTKKWGHSIFALGFKYLEFLFCFLMQYREIDFIHCNDLDTLPIGVLYRWIINRRVKIIYDAHEFEIDHATKSSDNMKKRLYYVERFFIKKVDAMITVGSKIADIYMNLYHIEKPTVVMNCPNMKDISCSNRILRTELGINDSDLLFIYQGGIGPGRSVELLLETFKLLPKHYVIVFMGYGPFVKEVELMAAAYSNIYYYPPVSYDKILAYTCSADYAFSLIENVNISYKYSLPNKFFEYINARVPVIVYSHGEMPNIVEDYSLGYIWDDKKEKLEEFLLKLPDMSKPKGLGSTIFNWENEEVKLIELYKKTLSL